jgi:hypothetical protein
MTSIKGCGMDALPQCVRIYNVSISDPGTSSLWPTRVLYKLNISVRVRGLYFAVSVLGPILLADWEAVGTLIALLFPFVLDASYRQTVPISLTSATWFIKSWQLNMLLSYANLQKGPLGNRVPWSALDMRCWRFSFTR